MKQHVQTQTEWENEMSVKVLDYVKDALYLELRYLSVALSALKPEGQQELITLATDGEMLYFSSEQLLRLFEKNDRYLNRLYLHTVLHCLFSHLWIGGERETPLWNLACDIAVEYVIDHLGTECTRRIAGWVRQNTYKKLEESGGGISAAVIYRWLKEQDRKQWEKLHEEFFADDHRYWPKEEKSRAVSREAQAKWNKIARQTSLEQRKQGDDPKEGEKLLQAEISAGRSRRSYGDFLKKFAIFREELQLDPEEFDINFYTYGLQFYKNMPLIEQMEVREVKKIQDFVIVIDTSYSTKGELVEGFLRETYTILSRENTFFRKARLRIIQCDEKVQRDDRIEDRGQLEQLLGHFELSGGGSTDFRPAFAYVNDLLEQGEFEHLCGLLYFTDGKGIYPKKRPAYQTAFLYLEDYDREQVPAWAMTMKLEPEELEAAWERGMHEH